VAAGLLTSALTLFGVYYLDNHSDDFHVMGWYADYVLPVGALLVGLVCGIGYGLASWLTGTKVTSRILWIVVGLLLACYFAARYIEYASLHLVYEDTGRAIPFLTYIDIVTRSFAWKNDTGGGTGDAFGLWGYAMLALEIGGFTLGGLLIPLGLRMKPYCDDCQLYMKSRKLGLLPASIAPRKTKNMDADAMASYDRESTEAFQKGKDLADSLQQQASSVKPKEFGQILSSFQAGQKEYAGLPVRIQVALVHCPSCRKGNASASFLSGAGKQLKTTPIFKVDVPSAFVDGLNLS
jgi:hypothetical protein